MKKLVTLLTMIGLISPSTWLSACAKPGDVSLNYLKGIKDKIKITDLGRFAVADASTLPEELDIIDALRHYNVFLPWDLEIKVFAITSTSAIIQVQGYEGIAVVNYETYVQINPYYTPEKKVISDKITYTNLGNILVVDADNPTNQEIIAVIEDYNQVQNINIHITINDDQKSAVISGDGYSGEVEVTFTLTSCINDLGVVIFNDPNNPTIQEIIAAFWANNPNLSSTNISGVTINDDQESALISLEGYSNQIKIMFNATSYLYIYDLGVIEFIDVTNPTVEEIIVAFNEKYANLSSANISSITINDDQKSAIIQVHGYSGTIEVLFNSKPLNSILVYTPVVIVRSDVHVAPNHENILAAIKKENPDFEGDISYQVISDNWYNQISTLRVSSDYYTGTVDVIVITKWSIKDVLVDVDLGVIEVADINDSKNESLIADAICNQNDLVDDSYSLEITMNDDKKSAVIRSGDYLDEITVTFDLRETP